MATTRIKVHISELYPVSKVTLSSELYYICELGKNLYYCNYVLSLDGVILDKVLRKSKFWGYFNLAMQNGWLTDTGLTIEPIDFDSLKNTVFNRLITETEMPINSLSDVGAKEYPVEPLYAPFEKMGDTWVWSDVPNNPDMRFYNSSLVKFIFRSQCMVALVAYVAIRRFFTGVPSKFTLSQSVNFVDNWNGSPDIYLLASETEAVPWLECIFDIPDDLLNQFSYFAWWYEGKEKGYHKEFYSVEEKIQRLKDLNLGVGDVVGLYARGKCQAKNRVKQIDSFHFAIIRGITSRTISLEVINTSMNYLTAKKRYAKLSMAVKDMYGMGHKPYKKFNSTLKTLDWYNTGVEHFLAEEEFFITPIYESDGRKIIARNESGDSEIFLPQTDLIYWILKDYNVKFNEDKFKITYFKDRSPIYDSYTHKEVKLKS